MFCCRRWTGLPGMRLVTDRLQVAISSAARTHQKVVLLFIDLDGFKAVNDGFGHDAGDAVLKEVAQHLRQTVRGEDTAACIGGDEFLVILSGLQDLGDVATVAEKLLAAIGKPIAISGADVQVGASIGIAVFPEHGNTVAALRQMADGTMYAVKKSAKTATPSPNRTHHTCRVTANRSSTLRKRQPLGDHGAG
jgi:diguanylate cyclase (GGDEF)-like protein